MFPFNVWLDKHYQSTLIDHQRLGQRFVNTYIKGLWPELFYADDGVAAILIWDWLVDNHYTHCLPPEIERN